MHVIGDIQETNQVLRMINRKSFFTTLGTGLAGYLITKTVFSQFFNRNTVTKNKKSLKVKINPYAVRREKTGRQNA